MAQDFSALLERIIVPPAQRFSFRRFVPKTSLDKYVPADYLFASGRPNRYNPKGVAALYVAADAATAGAELDRVAAKLGVKGGANFQQVLYTVDAYITLLDLDDPANLATLKLAPSALFTPWEFASAPTDTQRLGAAMAKQLRFGGIRFPSDAAKARGFVGHNVVLFKKSVSAQQWVVITNDADVEIQRWP